MKSGGLHEKHVVATWSVGNHLSIVAVPVVSLKVYETVEVLLHTFITSALRWG